MTSDCRQEWFAHLRSLQNIHAWCYNCSNHRIFQERHTGVVGDRVLQCTDIGYEVRGGTVG